MIVDHLIKLINLGKIKLEYHQSFYSLSYITDYKSKEWKDDHENHFHIYLMLPTYTYRWTYQLVNPEEDKVISKGSDCKRLAKHIEKYLIMPEKTKRNLLQDIVTKALEYNLDKIINENERVWPYDLKVEERNR